MEKKALKSKNIYMATSEKLVEGYIIINNNKIVAVVEGFENTQLIDEETKVFDFTNNFVMPGFHDYHVHIIAAAAIEKGGVLRYTKSEEEAAKLLFDLNKDSGKWILGGAWDPVLWPDQKLPNKATLDKYFPNTPVFLLNKEAHGAWVNSKALEIFNITKDTENPTQGEYFKDEEGELTGYVHEMAAFKMQEEIYGKITDEEMADYAKFFIDIANRYGITSLGDVAGGAPIRPEAYAILEKRGELNARINFSLGFATGVKDILKCRDEYDSQLLRCRGGKAFIDGTPQGYTGFMLEEYSDRPGFKSEPMIEVDEFKRQVLEFHEAGLQVRLHACGDAGARLCLDAIENAQNENGNTDLRHCVEHLESISPEDIPRFGELGVIASVQPEHMPKYDFNAHPFHGILGEERMRYCWPFESVRKAGGVLAYGTDCPIVSVEPCRGVFRAVNRLTNQFEPEGGWIPEERVSIHESLRAYTWGGAYGAGRDTELGTIEAGKLADIAVLEKNLFDCAYDSKLMFGMKVLMTMVDGKIVYEADKK